MNTVLNEDQRDALQELMNISMGRAANALARLIGTKVALSIPRIVAVTPEEFNRILSNNIRFNATCQCRWHFFCNRFADMNKTILLMLGMLSVFSVGAQDLAAFTDQNNRLYKLHTEDLISSKEINNSASYNGK